MSEILNRLLEVLPNVKSVFDLLVVVVILLFVAYLAIGPGGTAAKRQLRYVLLAAIILVVGLAVFAPVTPKTFEWAGIVQEDTENGVNIADAKLTIDAGIALPDDAVTRKSGPNGIFRFHLPDVARQRTVSILAEHDRYQPYRASNLTIYPGASVVVKMRPRQQQTAAPAPVGQNSNAGAGQGNVRPDSTPTDSPNNKPATPQPFTIIGDPASETFSILVPRGREISLTGNISDFIFGPSGPVGETPASLRTITAKQSLRFEKVIDQNGGAIRIHVDRDQGSGAVHVIRIPLRSATNIEQVLQQIRS